MIHRKKLISFVLLVTTFTLPVTLYAGGEIIARILQQVGVRVGPQINVELARLGGYATREAVTRSLISRYLESTLKHRRNLSAEDHALLELFRDRPEIIFNEMEKRFGKAFAEIAREQRDLFGGISTFSPRENEALMMNTPQVISQSEGDMIEMDPMESLSPEDLLIAKGGPNKSQAEARGNRLITAVERGFLREEEASSLGREVLNNALASAVRDGRSIRVLDQLLKFGADPDAKVEGTDHPVLHEAIKNGHESIVTTLLDKGANINSRGLQNNTPLIAAIQRKNSSITQGLIQRGADLDLRNEKGESALIAIMRYTDRSGQWLEILSDILSRKGDVNLEDVDGGTALIYASYYNWPEAVRLLVNAQANLDAVLVTDLAKQVREENEHFIGITVHLRGAPTRSYTALMWAASRNHVEVAQILAEAGADLTVRDERGFTALFNALVKGHDEVASIIIDAAKTRGVPRTMRERINRWVRRVLPHRNEAPLSVLDIPARESGNTPLLNVIKEGKWVMAEELIQAGADVNIADQEGMTALMLLLAMRQYGLAQMVIKSGASVNAVHRYGESPLLIAGRVGVPHDMIELLRKAGADVNAPVLDWEAPLVRAIDWERPETVTELIKAGVDVNAYGPAGETPLIKAIKKGRSRITRQLLEAGADPLQPNAQKELPIVVATEKGDAAAVKDLIDAGATVDGTINGETLLVYAVLKGNHEIVSHLMDAVFAIKAPPMWIGSKPLLLIAVQAGHARVVEVILKKAMEPDSRWNGLLSYELTARNSAGDRAIDIAKRQGNEEIVKLIESFVSQGRRR